MTLTPRSFTPAPGIPASSAPGTTAVPAVAWAHSQLAGLGLAALSALGCGLWALAPLGPARVTLPEIAAEARAEPPRSALDVAAFRAPLWFAPPPVAVALATPPPPPPPPPSPLRLQLLAIVREDAGYKALLYDPDADKVIALTEGGRTGPRSIARVTPTSVDVRDAAGVRTLALRDPPLRDPLAGGRP